MTDSNAAIGAGLPPWPEFDFTEFGEVEISKLSRIQKLTASYLHRNWLMIPHVTHHDQLDITETESHRKTFSEQTPNVKITPLVYQIKAIVAGLKKFPQFNASLDASGEQLILKKYFHIGMAVDTPRGLLVAVVRDCDKRSVTELAGEILRLGSKAREKGLSMAEMSGGCFTVSSLGGIGGTAFTPIINAPEVAILGISRAQSVPRPKGEGIDWRLLLPVSLSYDHRVINGADAARFTQYIGDQLADPAVLCA